MLEKGHIMITETFTTSFFNETNEHESQDLLGNGSKRKASVWKTRTEKKTKNFNSAYCLLCFASSDIVYIEIVRKTNINEGNVEYTTVLYAVTHTYIQLRFTENVKKL